MKLKSGLLGGCSGSLPSVTAYSHFGVSCLKKRVNGQRLPPLQLNDYSSWFSAISPFAAICSATFWEYYLQAQGRELNYQSSFIRFNYSRMYPSIDKGSALYTWGTVPPFIVQSTYDEGGTRYYLVGSGPSIGSMPDDIVDFWLYWPDSGNFTFWGGGFPREWFPAWMTLPLWYHGLMLICVLTRFNPESGDLVSCSDSLVVAVP